MHFNLRASDISALAGRNMYRSANSAVQDIVDGIFPDPGVERLRRTTAEIERLVRSGRHYTHAVGSVALDDTMCRLAEEESVQFFENCSTWIPHRERPKIRKSLRTVYLKDRGVWMEMTILKRLPLLGIAWRPTEKHQRFFTRRYLGTDNITYTINGCVDGLEFADDGGVVGLIEVKTRKDRISFPVHDLDQIAMYLVISDLPRGRLVQDANGHLNGDFIMSLAEAQERWDTMRPLLEASLTRITSRIDKRQWRTSRGDDQAAPVFRKKIHDEDRPWEGDAIPRNDLP